MHGKKALDMRMSEDHRRELFEFTASSVHAANIFFAQVWPIVVAVCHRILRELGNGAYHEVGLLNLELAAILLTCRCSGNSGLL